MRSGDWRWWNAMNELAAPCGRYRHLSHRSGQAAYTTACSGIPSITPTPSVNASFLSLPRVLLCVACFRGHGQLEKNLSARDGRESNGTPKIAWRRTRQTSTTTHRPDASLLFSRHPPVAGGGHRLAQWVIDMEMTEEDDFSLADRGDTGLASSTALPIITAQGRARAIPLTRSSTGIDLRRTKVSR